MGYLGRAPKAAQRDLFLDGGRYLFQLGINNAHAPLYPAVTFRKA